GLFWSPRAPAPPAFSLSGAPPPPAPVDRVQRSRERAMSIGAVREPSVHPFPVSSTPATPAADPEGSTPSTSDVPSVLATVLSGIGREVQHGESLVRSALGAARRGI